MLQFSPSPGILVVIKTDKKRNISNVSHYLCRIVNVHLDDVSNFPLDAYVEVRHEYLKPLYNYPQNKPTDLYTIDTMSVDGYYMNIEEDD
jgi:hypothetical protein